MPDSRRGVGISLLDYPILLWPILSGKGTWYTVHVSKVARGAFSFLPYTGKYHAVQPAHRPEPHRYGDVIRSSAPASKISPSPRMPGIETEMTAKIAKVPGLRIYEAPVQYHGRTYAEGKK